MPLDRALDSGADALEGPKHFDPAALRHDLFDSTPALFSVLRTFQPWLADMRQQLRAAVDADDTPQLARTAHTLRGGLAQLRAQAAVDRVRRLEALCKPDPAAEPSDHPGWLALEAELEAELEALGAEIAALLASAQPIAPLE
jgi:HPt (histidine-containing phosphotransfer) domain-containing protein